jgi:hypothetical protein
LRLGEINAQRYNWPPNWCPIERFKRDRRSLNVFDRFRLLFPLFVVHRFPADFVGSSLCWRGTVVWERAGQRFETIEHANMACRELRSDDAGRRIFAVSIKRDARLAMSLHANGAVQLRRAIEYGLMLAGMSAVILLLVRINPRRLRLPAVLIGFSLLVVVVVDINFIGGFRPLDDADDGLTYEGFARVMVHHVLAGNVVETLKGVEPVYYFTPGFRYFRTIERLLFGDTYLGYLSVILAFPFIVLALFRRFLPERWALVLILAFVATPVGALFGSSFLYYASWAARGFADPFAFALLFAGFLLIIPKPAEVDDPRTLPAFIGAVMLAAATFCRPNLLLASGMMVACAALLAIMQRRFDRTAALAGGFATLAVSPLHNYLFGNSTVLFSNNVNQPQTLLMSPLDYLKAAGEMLRLEFTGPHVVGAVQQLGRWLTGPTEILALVPVHAAAVVALVRVGVFGSRFDPWLRLVALATLLQHGIGICYVNNVRYNLGTWLLTALVAAVWLHAEGLPLFDRAWPGLRERWMRAAWLQWLADRLRRIERALGGSAVNGKASAH